MKRTALVAAALAAMFGVALWNVVESSGPACAVSSMAKQRRACDGRIDAAREADARTLSQPTRPGPAATPGAAT
jgi:hypothetical protein